MQIKGVDVSTFQGNIDWEKVKAAGIGFAILRVGYGSDMKSQDDRTFKRNADECTRLGIPFGVYIYSYANSIDKAISEAKHTLRLIKGYNLSYPVFYDLEDVTTSRCTKDLIGRMADAYCEAIAKAGYKVGIYANKYWFENILISPVFNKYDKWIAQYNSKCTYQGKYTMWQYSSSEIVPGIKGKCDVNYCYVDYVGKDPEVKPSTPTVNSNLHLKDLQFALNEDKIRDINGKALTEDGLWGPLTASAVNKVTLSSKTRGRYTNITSWVQCRVGANADGIYGDNTTEKVKEYQRKKKLTSDGIVGPKTMNALLKDNGVQM